jgi:hypothetical protein
MIPEPDHLPTMDRMRNLSTFMKFILMMMIQTDGGRISTDTPHRVYCGFRGQAWDSGGEHGIINYRGNLSYFFLFLTASVGMDGVLSTSWFSYICMAYRY